MNETTTTIKRILRARSVATPLIAVRTADPWRIQNEIMALESIKGPRFSWDCSRGFVAFDEESKQAFAALNVPPEVTYPSEALKLIADLPERSLVVAHLIGRFVSGTTAETAAVVQSIMNLRDPFASNRRTLVMLGSDFELPAELQQDVLVIDCELPDLAGLAEIAKTVVASTIGEKQAAAIDEKLPRIAATLRGLSPFAAEQAVAESIDKAVAKGTADGDLVDLSYLRQRRIAMLSQIDGLTITEPKERFEQLGGLAGVKRFFTNKINGKLPPAVVVFIDEIEKSLENSGGADGGAGGRPNRSVLKYFLTAMEDNGWSGSIFLGHPGAGKTVFSRAFGGESGALFVELDIGAFFGEFVGQTESRARNAMSTLKSIGGDRVFIVGSCNAIRALPTELQRRFADGTFMFDLPDQAEVDTIAEIYRRKYDLLGDDSATWREGWTGAEIRTAARFAWEFGCPLREACEYVVPVFVRSPENVEALRSQADGRYRSASRPGVYVHPKKTGNVTPLAGRRAAIGEE